MTYLVKLTPPDDDPLYYRDGRWTQFKHEAQDFDSKSQAESVVQAAQVFTPTDGEVEVVKA